jgi:hypothetical protein
VIRQEVVDKVIKALGARGFSAMTRFDVYKDRPHVGGRVEQFCSRREND